ncbi:Protein of unknown function [Cotesia congregata]|uniref:EGF-like domain-containing protein n=1 Tax=Cotesia congregata TaxID=51543 RepID=A0A8J2HA67_COTCN|nr:Protein of unknown function [Cotesia congregata]
MFLPRSIHRSQRQSIADARISSLLTLQILNVNQASALGKQCNELEDCSIILNSVCSSNGICICPPNYFAIGNHLCAPTINSDCLSDEECLSGVFRCVDSKCQCIHGYTAISVDRCVNTNSLYSCKETSECSDSWHWNCAPIGKCVCHINNIAINNSTCLPLLNGYCWKDDQCMAENSVCIDYQCGFCAKLEASCVSDEDCWEIKHAKCSTEKKCDCRANNLRLNETYCAPSLGGFCWKNETCVTRNALCIDSECRCRKNYSASEDQCLPVLIGLHCSEDIDCAKIRFAKCSKNNYCVCSLNTVVVNDISCEPVLNSYCTTDSDCLLNNSVCKNNKCQCRPEYVAINSIQCIQLELGMSCTNDDFCNFHISHSICSPEKKCVCSPNSYYYNRTVHSLLFNMTTNYEQCRVEQAFCLDNKCFHHSVAGFSDKFCFQDKNCFGSLLGELCNVDKDCLPYNSVCLDKKCMCAINYRNNSILSCLPSMLNQNCWINSHCSAIPNAECSDYQCTCKAGYAESNAMTCSPLLGTQCTEHEECAVRYSICFDGECECADFFVPQSNNRCQSKILHKSCETDRDCENIKFSYCSSSNLCSCIRNNIALNGSACGALLNQYCSHDLPCVTENSVCVNDKCECKSFFKNSDAKCLPTARLEECCDNNYDCTMIKYAECSTSKKCSCLNNYVSVNSTLCKAVLHEHCQVDDECYIGNSECVANKCRCRDNFSAVGSNSRCESSTLGKRCNISKDCLLISNSICSSDKICVCPPNYSAVGSYFCTPTINAACSNDIQCSNNLFRCVDGKCQCNSGYTAISVNKCMKTSLIYSCEKTSECSDSWHWNCATNGKCVCHVDNMAINNSTCLPSLNGYCWREDQCMAENSVCTDYRCQCKPNFVAVANNHCVAVSVCGMTFFSDTAKLEASCVSDEDCWEIKHAKCSTEKKCDCRANNLRLNETYCAPSLGGFCWKNETCVTRNALCIDNECRCRKNYSASEDQCLPVIGSLRCRYDRKCARIRFAKCSKNNYCVCSLNTVVVNNISCEPVLNSYCTTDSDCLLNNSVCKNNKCQCRPKYVAINSNQCIRPELGMSCINDDFCNFHISHSICSPEKKCVCSPNSYYYNRTVHSLLFNMTTNYEQCRVEQAFCLDNKCFHHSVAGFSDKFCFQDKNCFGSLLGELCNVDKDCLPYNSVCLDKKCMCAINYRNNSILSCLPSMLNQNCWINSHCSAIPNAECSDYQCTCKAGYVESNAMTCSPLLGTQCTKDDECAVRYSICFDGECECADFFVPQSNNRCQSTARLEECCDNNYDCTMIKYAECSTSKKCSCLNNYVSVNSTLCEALLHEHCQVDDECYIGNSECVANKCRCRDNFSAVGSNSRCESSMLGKRCNISKDCSMIKNSICSSDKICVCPPNYSAVGSYFCTPTINAACSNDIQCSNNLFRCVDGKCQCNSGYTAISVNKCMKTSLIYSCEKTSECSDSWHWNCATNGKCVCHVDNMAINNSTCLPSLNGYCWREDQCMAENSVCTDYRCQCKPNFVAVANNHCSCETDRDCENIKFSYCSSSNLCSCTQNNIALNGSACGALLNQYCSHDLPCVTENSVCVNDKCECKPFFKNSDAKCLSTRLGKTCDNNSDCNMTKYAECSTSKKCSCLNNYVSVNSTLCEALLHEHCQVDDECYVGNSECVANKCQCRDDFLAVDFNSRCESRMLGKRCNTSEDCSMIKNSICSSDKICICPPKYFALDNHFCIPTINATCLNDIQCSDDLFHCVDGKCQCKSGYTAISVDRCMETRLMYSCNKTSECSDSWHWNCATNKKCVCRVDNMAMTNLTICLPSLNGFCWRDDQCVAKNSVCKDYYCQCKPYFVAVANNHCAIVYLPGHFLRCECACAFKMAALNSLSIAYTKLYML